MRDELDPGTAWHTKMDGWRIFPMKDDGATPRICMGRLLLAPSANGSSPAIFKVTPVR